MVVNAESIEASDWLMAGGPLNLLLPCEAAPWFLYFISLREMKLFSCFLLPSAALVQVFFAIVERAPVYTPLYISVIPYVESPLSATFALRIYRLFEAIASINLCSGLTSRNPYLPGQAVTVHSLRSVRLNLLNRLVSLCFVVLEQAYSTSFCVLHVL